MRKIIYLCKMALVKTSALVSDIRGKLGGSVFQNSASGLVIRNLTKCKNKASKLQQEQRAATNQAQKDWQALNSSNRAKYKSLGQLAQIRQKNIYKRLVSAHSLFIKSNSVLIRYGLSSVSNPALNQSEITPIVATLTNNAGSLILGLDRNLVFADELLVLFISSPVIDSISTPRNRMRLIVFTQSSTNSFDITSVIANVFGAVPSTDEFVFMKYYICGKKTPIFGPETIIKTTIL